MNNTELINAYFEGQLSDSERGDLLERLNNDSDLKQEFNFQSDIIEGLKNVRKAELKARLDAVPVGTSFTVGSTLTKVAVIGGALLISGIVLFNLTSNENNESLEVNPKIVQENVEDLLPPPEEETEANEEEINNQNETKVIPPSEEVNPVSKEVVISKPEINKPIAVQPMDITESEEEEILPESQISESSISVSSPVEVDIDNTKRRYTFHYQMKEGKLFLFGDFDKDLYEILEFNSVNNKNLYLFYKDRYYNLDKMQSEIKPLQQVTQSELLTKLEEARMN